MKNRMFEVKARAWVITFALLITYHLSLVTSTAQTFTQHVQEQNSGEGVVTIHQDAAIDRLINGSPAKTKVTATGKNETAATTAAKPAKTVTTAAKPAKTAKPTTSAKSTTTAATEKPAKTASTSKPAATAATEKPAKTASTSKPAATAETAKPAALATKTKPATTDATTKPAATTKPRPQSETVPASVPDTLTTTTTPDTTTTSPAPLRHGYKTTGYRVQAFAGGNTRTDRQKAERTGNALRQLFPGEDVYVRFYSPRWVCRLGNYRTYEEAHEKMLTVRKLGYETATIVKGKIIIYD